MFVINSIVDLKKNQLKLEPGMAFNCVQGDNGASYKIVFNFNQCINTETISGILTFVLPDGTEYVDSITFEDPKKAHYKLKDELLVQEGKIEVSLTLLDENRFTVYTYFNINVKKKLSKDPIDIDPQDPTYLLLQSLLLEVRNLETSIENAEAIRLVNEDLRISSEDSRIAMEELRQQAENIRIENENLRVDEWASLKQQILDALANLHDGKDATINGYNAIEIEGGENIEFEQNENNFKINWKPITWKNI